MTAHRPTHSPLPCPRRPRPWRLLLATALLLLPGVLHAESPLALRPQVEVASESVRVKDLVDGPLPASLARQADTLVLKAPLPGNEHILPGPFLARKLAFLAGVERLEATTPARVRITRTGQEIDDSRLTPLLEQVARTTWKEPVTVTGLRVVGRRPLPIGPLALTPDTTRVRIRKGRIELPVNVSVGGDAMGRITLTAEVSVMKQVVVTTAPVAKGEGFTPALLTLAPRPLPPSDHDAITELAQAVGHMATHPLSAGTVLTSAMVKSTPLVTRGDDVRIRYAAGDLVITATGIAAETGGLGEFIRVKNSRSGKHITCRITGERIVEPFL